MERSQMNTILVTEQDTDNQISSFEVKFSAKNICTSVHVKSVSKILKKKTSSNI